MVIKVKKTHHEVLGRPERKGTAVPAEAGRSDAERQGESFLLTPSIVQAWGVAARKDGHKARKAVQNGARRHVGIRVWVWPSARKSQCAPEERWMSVGSLPTRATDSCGEAQDITTKLNDYGKQEKCKDYQGPENGEERAVSDVQLYGAHGLQGSLF